MQYDSSVIEKTADELIYLMGTTWEKNEDGYLADDSGETLGEHIREILAKNLQISNKLAKSSGLSDNISTALYELTWSPIDTIQTGIGQGYVQVTPIAVARYVAAIANGGTVYETHLVDKVIAQDGTVVYDKEPVVYNTLDAKPEYINAIKEGMRSVVSEEEGTASEAFSNFPDEYLQQLGGKTGSAEVNKDIDLENNSWFVCFAPFEDPEIALVVYVPRIFCCTILKARRRWRSRRCRIRIRWWCRGTSRRPLRRRTPRRRRKNNVFVDKAGNSV
jgi:signal peptidase I